VTWRALWVLIASATTAAFPSAMEAAEAGQAGSVLIRNVTLTHQENLEDGVIVSVLLQDGKLELVTEEVVPVDSAELAVDAELGVLTGC